VFPEAESFEHFESRIHNFLSAHEKYMIEILRHAEQVGTVNQVDRSAQYDPQNFPAQLPPPDSPKQLLKAANEAWSKIRDFERKLAAKDNQIAVLTDQLKRANRKIVVLGTVLTSPGWIMLALRLLGR
jgi:hypothetical protein